VTNDGCNTLFHSTILLLCQRTVSILGSTSECLQLPENREEQTEKGKSQVYHQMCEWTRVYCSRKSLSISLVLLSQTNFYPQTNRKLTQPLHFWKHHAKERERECTVNLFSINVPQNWRVWAGHTSYSSSKAEIIYHNCIVLVLIRI